MFFLHKQTKIYYENEILGENLLIFLHGWGCNIDLIKPLSSRLNENFSKIYIDFPPFGKSEEPKSPWTLDDYCIATKNIIEKVVEKLRKKNFKINKVILIGHSFGGRVAIKLAKSIKCDGLILISSAGIKPKFSLNTKFKVLQYKFYKKIGNKKAKNFGSSDYRTLSDVMKQTFNNIIGEDLKNDCMQITAKTLILNGDKDKETPLYMGKIINKLIKNSSLIVIKNGDHFFYLKQLEKTKFLIENFLLSEVT